MNYMTEMLNRAKAEQQQEINKHIEEYTAAFLHKWGDIDPRKVQMCTTNLVHCTKFWLEPRDESTRDIMEENFELARELEKTKAQLALAVEALDNISNSNGAYAKFYSFDKLAEIEAIGNAK